VKKGYNIFIIFSANKTQLFEPSIPVLDKRPFPDSCLLYF